MLPTSVNVNITFPVKPEFITYKKKLTVSCRNSANAPNIDLQIVILF